MRIHADPDPDPQPCGKPMFYSFFAIGLLDCSDIDLWSVCVLGWYPAPGERADQAGGGEEGFHLAPPHTHPTPPTQIFSQEGRWVIPSDLVSFRGCVTVSCSIKTHPSRVTHPNIQSGRTVSPIRSEANPLVQDFTVSTSLFFCLILDLLLSFSI